MRFTFPLVAVLCFAGCPSFSPYLPDGGRARVACNDAALTVPVTVLDRAGDPAPMAVVAVEYTSYGESENLIADVNGKVLVQDKFGPGTVKVQGNVNDLRTQFGELNFNGSDCSSSVTPRSLTLQLQ
jgi:hypothetical protein